MLENFALSDNFHVIDQNRLDEECLRQPEMQWTASQELTQAKRHLNELEALLKLKRAEFANRIRKNPDDFFLELGAGKKPSNDLVADTVEVMPVVIELTKQIIAQQEIVDTYTGALAVLSTRKTMLELQVQLAGQGYFAAVKTTPEGVAAIKGTKPVPRPAATPKSTPQPVNKPTPKKP